MRSQFASNIARGGCWSGKVQRYLRAAGLDNPIFLTDEARKRHVHPRHLRSQSLNSVSSAVGERELASDPGLLAGPTKINPFAQFGKKSDAPAS